MTAPSFPPPGQASFPPPGPFLGFPPPKKKAGAGKVVGFTLLGLVVFGGCVSAVSGGDDTDKVATSSTSSESKAAPAKKVEDPAKAAAEKAAEDKAAADKAAADKVAAAKAAADKAAADKKAAEAEARKGTTSQQNAYKAAEEYLDFSAFSRAGLIGQLTSDYGSQFPKGDAEFAVARLEREGKVDWNAEAAEAAKDYLETSSFSRQGLLDQLTSQYGSQFTRAQAEYGVNQTGL